MKIVIFPHIDETRLALVAAAAADVPVMNCSSPGDAQREIVDASGFFGKLTPDLLSRAECLTWVQAPTASLEHYLFPELVEHPCQLTNMRGLFYDVIADHVFAYILCIARNLHLYLRQQMVGVWSPIGRQPTQADLFSMAGTASEIDRRHLHISDCTLGVVGVGSIGAEVCRRGAAFGMEILGVDPNVRTVPGVDANIWGLDGLNNLLERSDFVVIAAPHTPRTVKLFRLPQFESMKSTAWCINIGRGVIVDLADLTQALQDRMIGGAALDVFEEEPLPADHPLWKMENVILTPHVAAASPRVAERHLETLLENVRQHVNGGEFRTIVSKYEWY